MSLAKFFLKMRGPTHAESLLINDVEYGDQVRAVRYEGATHDVGRLIVEFLTDDVTVEGEGIVYISRDADLQGFFDNLDRTALEQEVLRRQDWGTSPVATTVDLIKEWLLGGDPA